MCDDRRPFWGAESEVHLCGQCCGPRVGANQQRRRSKMTAEITKDKSKIEAEVIKAIKSGFAVTAKQNNWVKMTGCNRGAAF